jgi:hypothetical protein
MILRLRSRLRGHRQLNWGAVFLAGMISLFVPVLLGLCMVYLGQPLGELIGFTGDLPILVSAIGMMLVYSPLLSWAGMFIGALLSVMAMIYGWAGPGMAILGGAGIGWGIAQAIDSAIVLPVIGAICGGVYWLMILVLCPDAVAPRQSDESDT